MANKNDPEEIQIQSESGPGDDLNNDDKTSAKQSNSPRSLLSGVLASIYCVIAGILGITGISSNFFVNLQTSYTAFAFGAASLILLAVLSRQYVPVLSLMGRNFAIVFALMLIIMFFTHGGQPSVQEILRLVLQLAIAWIVFSTFSQMRKLSGK